MYKTISVFVDASSIFKLLFSSVLYIGSDYARVANMTTEKPVKGWD